MIRILFKLCFWVIVARWTYAEVKLLAPSATPVIDYALQTVQIPTHDKWSRESFDAWLAKAKGDTQASVIAARTKAEHAAGQALRQFDTWTSIPQAEAKALSTWARDSEAFTKF